MIYILIGLFFLLNNAVSWSFALSVSVVLYEFVSLPYAFGIAAAMGVIEDIIALRPIGLTSILLITCFLFSWLLKTYYREYSVWWMLFFGIIGQVVMHRINNLPITIDVVVGQLLTVGSLYFVRRKLFDRDGVYVGI